MSAAAPWSVKGIDPKAREIAKDLARRSGMTLGEWLNSMIMDEPDEDEGVTPLPRRTPIPDPYDRRSRSRRLDDVYGYEDDRAGRIGASLEVIAERLEAVERRSTVAIQGVDQAVAGLVRRLEKQDEIGLGYARRIDDIADELREGHKRLRRFEQETGPKSEEGFARLDAALGAVSSRLFDLDERQRNTIGDLQARMEAVEKAAGPGPGTDVLAQVGVRLDEAQERTSEALKGLERSFAALDQLREIVRELGEHPVADVLHDAPSELGGLSRHVQVGHDVHIGDAVVLVQARGHGRLGAAVALGVAPARLDHGAPRGGVLLDQLAVTLERHGDRAELDLHPAFEGVAFDGGDHRAG